jgi:thioredoxin-related protein
MIPAKKLDNNAYATSDVTEELENGQIEAKINDLVSKHEIIMFSKTSCPFCLGLVSF